MRSAPFTASSAYSLILVVASACVPLTAVAQPTRSDDLVNGGFEEVTDDAPRGWFFASPSGGRLSLDSDQPFAGDRSAQLDATPDNPTADGRFTNVMQTLNGAPWQGKTVRFRAAVRTAELEEDAKAQLWFRVDLPDRTSGRMGAFDNMQDRPIRSGDWAHYEIVLKVDDDAVQIVVGMFLLGKGKAWIDDATFEVVNESTPTTEMSIGSASAAGSATGDEDQSDESDSASPFQISPILMKAMSEAENAPQQSFWTPWLVLVVVAMTLFALSGLPPRTFEVEKEGAISSYRALGFMTKFALRFSVAYWLLYSLPSPFSSLIPYLGSKLYVWHQQLIQRVVPWTAENVFRIEGELVPPNGSGDTTFNYIQVFLAFVLAIAIATLWSLVDWRKTDCRHIKDLLRSYLRYVLALTMLGYGLAKVAWDMNQFPTPSDGQLAKTWGDSSPMNLMWTFMGASRAYTVFAGMGEVVGALLLVWRRTATIGAVVVFGVMLNVFMLNMCYDVPVKLYSFHLVCMALYIAMPDFGRLANVLFWNRATEVQPLRPPYTGRITIWIHWLIKAAILIIGFGIPIYQHVDRQVEYFDKQSKLPRFFDRFEVVEFKLNGETIDPAEDDAVWQNVRFQQLPYNSRGERVPTNWMFIGLSDNRTATGQFTYVDEGAIQIEDRIDPAIPVGRVELLLSSDDDVTLTGELGAGSIEVLLRRKTETTRLTRRGFRWINEVPFNR